MHLVFLFCAWSLNLITVPIEANRELFAPKCSLLSSNKLRLKVTSSDRYAKCYLSDNICTDLYTMSVSFVTQGQCGWVSVPGMQKQHVVLFSCHALNPCSMFCQCYELLPLSSLSLLNLGLLRSVLVWHCAVEANFYWHTAMSLGWILCSALNMVFPCWVCGWLSEGNSQEFCYTSEISTCEWSQSNLCGPDGLDSMKPQNIS